MPPAIPPLLVPYLALPKEASLILLTSVLGASTNWLVARFITSSLSTLSSFTDSEAPSVLLISFLRDAKFFADSSKRLGVDLGKLQTTGRFAFVDGLTGLFDGSSNATGRLAVRRETIDGVSLMAGTIGKIQDGILQRRKELKDAGKKCLLLLDGLDLVLAAGGEGVTAQVLGDMLIELQQHFHATILTLSADTPLVHEQQSPLEMDHSSFLLTIAHQANLIMSLRLLDTGTARDVSGVLRITQGQDVEVEDGLEELPEERELLYYIASDGGARVFERGQ